MAKEPLPESDITTILEQAANDERRLLKLERKAEKRVASLRSDLAKAQVRYEAVRVRHDELLAQVNQRAQALADAENEFAQHHAARATGPNPGGNEA